MANQRDLEEADRLSSAAAIYRHEGDATTALKIEAVLQNLDNGRPVRVVDLDAAHALADAVLMRAADAAEKEQS